jgi:hypothetical protein
VPTQIIELDALVPDAIEFRYQDNSYVLPGDISVETTFHLQKLLTALAQAEANPKAVDEQEKLTLEVEQVLLGLFRQHDPKLEALPFGVVGFRYVLAHILTVLGFGRDEPADDPPRATPRDRLPPRNSRRSNTSRSS